MNRLILLTFIILVSNSNNAFAYLDPGTGSIILQAILGAIAAGLTFLTNFWLNVKNFLKKIFKKKDNKK